MVIDTDVFGEEIPIWTTEEEMAAIRAYRSGNYGELTALEIEYIREALEDPNGEKFDREHAGMFSCEVDPLDFRGLVFIYDLGRNFEEGYQILHDKLGPHPITPMTLHNLNKELYNEYVHE